MRSTFVILALALVGCSKPAPVEVTVGQPVSGTPGPATTSSKNPIAKFIELSGFRLKESGGGKLEVNFVAVNHSDADLGDLEVHVRLVTTASKPDDPPITEFDAKISSLGPQEIKDVSAHATTKLKMFELPDWQFLRGESDITAPAP